MRGCAQPVRFLLAHIIGRPISVNITPTEAKPSGDPASRRHLMGNRVIDDNPVRMPSVPYEPPDYALILDPQHHLPNTAYIYITRPCRLHPRNNRVFLAADQERTKRPRAPRKVVNIPHFCASKDQRSDDAVVPPHARRTERVRELQQRPLFNQRTDPNNGQRRVGKLLSGLHWDFLGRSAQMNALPAGSALPARILGWDPGNPATPPPGPRENPPR